MVCTRVASALVVTSLACSNGSDDPPSPAPTPDPGLAFTDFITGLGQTTDLAFLPDGRVLVTEKTGEVKTRLADGRVIPAGSFPVDTESEKGLLGVVASPDFAQTRRVFLYYSASDAAGGADLDRHRVVSIAVREDGTLDPASEQVLVSGLRGPANHDGGALAVGPDGRLYIGVGDTGCNSGRPPEPPQQPRNFFATCLSNGNGKILRVNPDGTIPADNPLAAAPSATACGSACGDAPQAGATAAPRRDIWAWGFRNPWRFAFDPVTGRLWVGDVGEITYEEITIVRRGAHHGWPWREGGRGHPPARCRETVPDAGDCVDPVYYCAHDAGAGVDADCGSITGGAFAEGEGWPAGQRGRYWFADNVTGRFWSVQLTPLRDGVVPGSRVLIRRFEDGSPVSIRTGNDGALYLAILPGRVVRYGPP